MNTTICDIGSRSNISLCEYLATKCDKKYYFLARELYCAQSFTPNVLLAVFSLAILVCVTLLVILVGTILSTYFLNSVTNFTDLLHLRHEILGYVVIPLMNGAPDIVNSHLMIKSKSMNLVMGQIIGANLISFTVIVGSISIMKPFKVSNKQSLSIGYCFVCLMVLILSYVLLDGKITLIECLVLSSLYPIHIILASFDRSIEPLTTDLERSISKDPESETSRLLASADDNGPTPETVNLNFKTLKIFVEKISIIVDHVLFFFIPVSKTTLLSPIMATSSLKSRLVMNMWFQFWLVLVSTFLLNSCTLELPPKTLIYILPIALFVSRIFNYYLSPNLSAILLDLAGVANSLALITIITKVLIRLLKNLGVMWQISEYVMGLLVFSLVSCLNDILMNTLLALKYSPSLGIKACMSSCCLLILIGIGFNGLWDLVKTGIETGKVSSSLSLPITLTWQLYVSLISLNLTVISTLTYMLVNKWTLDRYLGFGLIGIWLTSTCACIGMELH